MHKLPKFQVFLELTLFNLLGELLGAQRKREGGLSYFRISAPFLNCLPVTTQSHFYPHTVVTTESTCGVSCKTPLPAVVNFSASMAFYPPLQNLLILNLLFDIEEGLFQRKWQLPCLFDHSSVLLSSKGIFSLAGSLTNSPEFRLCFFHLTHCHQ